MRYAFILFLSCIGCLAHAQEVTSAHERIGETIGPAERTYFGLFPDIEGFASASFVALEDSVLVEIDSEQTTLRRYLLPSQFDALGKYVATFERHPSAFANPNWQRLVRSTKTLASPTTLTPFIDSKAPNARVIVDGTRYDGVVLSASDTLLLLHPAGQAYDWQAPALHAFDPADVQHVRVSGRNQDGRASNLIQLASVGGGLLLAQPFFFDLSEGGFRYGGVSTLVAGAALGHLVGQALTDERPPTTGSYPERLTDLQYHASFRTVWPIDLAPAEAARRGYAAPALTPRSSVPARLRAWWDRYGLVNVSVIGFGTTFEPDPPVYDEFLGRRTEQLRTETGVRPTLLSGDGIDLALRPIPWIRFGLAIQAHTPDGFTYPRENTSALFEIATHEVGAFRPYIEAILPSPSTGGFHLEVAVGAGLETHDIRVFREPTDAFVPIDYEVREEGSNLFTQATLELVTPHLISFFARYTDRSLPTLKVEEFIVETSQRDPLYRLSKHTVEFGYRELVLGTRFRF